MSVVAVSGCYEILGISSSNSHVSRTRTRARAHTHTHTHTITHDRIHACTDIARTQEPEALGKSAGNLGRSDGNGEVHNNRRGRAPALNSQSFPRSDFSYAFD